MNVTTIRYLKRIQENQFEPAELELTATVEEGESAEQAIMSLKVLVHRALTGALTAPGVALVEKPSLVVEKVELKPLGNEPAATANFVKETLDNGQAIPPVIEKKKAAPRTKAAKATTEESAPATTPSENGGGASTVVGSVDRENVSGVQPEVPKTGASVGKGIVAYDKTIKEHRSRFATYLGTNHKGWQTKKPAEEIAAFSAGLHGKPFEDTKGNMLESFKAELKAFFG